MNFYLGRKNMFLKIKNKFRFVSISLLLASLVTLVSSASAEEETGGFDFVLNVACAPEQSSASWEPVLDTYFVDSREEFVEFPSGYLPAMSISALPGQTVEIQIFLNWEAGTDCSGTTVPATGEFSGIFVGLPAGYTSIGSDNIVAKVLPVSNTEIYDSFEIPDDALPDVISGSYELTWTPE